MDDRVDAWVLGKDFLKLRLVADVHIVEGWLLAADKLNPVQGLDGRVVEVVNNDDIVPGGQELEGGEGTNVARSAEARSLLSASVRGAI